MDNVLRVCVGGEAHGLVAALPKSRQGYSSIQRAQALCPHRSEEELDTVAMLRHDPLKSLALGFRILSLKSNFDDLHRRYHRNCFGDPCGQASYCSALSASDRSRHLTFFQRVGHTYESAWTTDHSCVLISQQLFVGFEARKSNGHFRNYARENYPKAPV